jgi:nitroreductase
MTFDRPLEEIVLTRKSVRTYLDKRLPDDTMRKLERYAEGLTSPFGGTVRFRLLKSGPEAAAEKLGTYGMIKGASCYIAAAAGQSKHNLEALGYQFEQLVLYATTLDLGTCWLGGTFQKSRFAAAMHVGPDEIFPVVSPVGYPAEQMRVAEGLMRRFVGADHRKPWRELFFDETFARPLTMEAAGEFSLPLELVRRAPSASNRQPWRIVRAGDVFHFYEHKIPGYSSMFPYDIQRIDLGIAACHFELAARELGLAGAFIWLEQPVPDCPANTHYIVSWKAGLPEEAEEE